MGKKTKEAIRSWAPRTALMVMVLALGFQVGIGCAAWDKAAPVVGTVVKALCPKCGDVVDMILETTTSGHDHSTAPVTGTLTVP